MFACFQRWWVIQLLPFNFVVSADFKINGMVVKSDPHWLSVLQASMTNLFGKCMYLSLILQRLKFSVQNSAEHW